MKPQVAVRGFSIALLMASAALPVRAASFTAEFVDTRGGETEVGTFNFQDQSYRFDVLLNGQPLVVTCDGPTGVTRLLVAAQKMYVEAGPDEPMSRMMSPFAFYAYYARTKEVRTEGVENVGEVQCTKRVAFAGEQVFATAWFSETYNFPLKVDVPIVGRTVELRNIKAAPQDATLFAVPADYQPAPKPAEPPPPEWVAQVSSAPLLTPPFERAMAEGKIVRMRVQAGRPLRLGGTNKTQETCAFTSVPFKNGRPLGDPSFSTVNLEADQEVSTTYPEGPAEADEIVVHVRNGTVTIKAEFVPAPGAPRGDETSATSPAATETPEPSAEVDAPDSAPMASRFAVQWTGPANNDDFISVARPNQPPGTYLGRTSVREGSPLQIWAPSEPGEFEVRYVVGRGSKLLAKATISITAVTATVAATGPVKVADWIDVRWQGPAGEGDYVSVARPEQAPGASINVTRVKSGTPLRVRAPSDPGEYEVRYVLGRGSRLLARTPITIEAVAATVSAPATAVTGTEFEVHWTGPGYPEDVITIARANQSPAANVGTRPTRLGNPAKLRAPKDAGDYEVRYILGRGSRLVAKTTITIEAPPPQ